jgi:hypothetical protein
MQKPVIQTAAEPSLIDSTRDERTKAADEEDSDKRMKHQRLQGHDDVRGYSHVVQVSFHALADSFHVSYDHLSAKKRVETSFKSSTKHAGWFTFTRRSYAHEM